MKRVFLATIIAAIIVLAAGTVTYFLTRPPTPIGLKVADGSQNGIIEGNFQAYTDYAVPFVRFFNATTSANQTVGSSSTLMLQLHTRTVYDPGVGLAYVDIFAAVQGQFASNLKPSGVTLTLNESGQYIGGTAFGVATPATGLSWVSPNNVSFGPGSSSPTVSLDGPAVANLTPILLNDTGSGPFYQFVYPVFFSVWEVPTGDHFIGLRVMVTGPFVPAVSVGILLQIVDIEDIVLASAARSSGGTSWVLNLTSVPVVVSNRTTYLTILSPTGATMVPSTALGSLYTSPYNKTIAYEPWTTGSSTLHEWDTITLAAATYGVGCLVQISDSSSILFSGPLQ